MGEYRLGSLEIGNCHQLGWFRMELKPSIKILVNHPHRSTGRWLADYLSAHLSSYLLVYSTNASYVDVSGRYYGSSNSYPLPLSPNPILGPTFGFAHFERIQEEEDESTTKHTVSIYSLGFSLPRVSSFQEASLEIQFQ